MFSVVKKEEMEMFKQGSKEKFLGNVLGNRK